MCGTGNARIDGCVWHPTGRGIGAVVEHAAASLLVGLWRLVGQWRMAITQPCGRLLGTHEGEDADTVAVELLDGTCRRATIVVGQVEHNVT